MIKDDNRGVFRGALIMRVPDYQTLMLPVLRTAESGEVRIGFIIEQLANEFNLSEEERAELLPSGKWPKFSNRVHWAKTYLVKAGLLQSTRRGHVKITDRGLAVLAEKPARIDNEYLSQFEEFREFRQRSRGATDVAPVEGVALESEIQTPDEIIRQAQQRIELALAKELLDRILNSSPAFFEEVMVNLLVAMGYGGSIENAGRALGRSGDGGVDGVIDQDLLGLDRVYVQAKRYAVDRPVSASEIRDFFGSLDTFRANKGVFVTTSKFSQPAQEAAEKMSKRLVLIDGDRLAALMIRHNVGVRVEQTIHLKKIDEDFFPE